MDDSMSFQAPLPRVKNCFAFNYLEYDTSIPGIVEGRIHPIQFSNCVTRLNVAARTHRDKCLFLLIMFTLGLVLIIVYPFVDTTYFMFILLVFVPLSIIEYIMFIFMKRRTLKHLADAVEQENEIFLTNGMRLLWNEKSKEIFVEVVRRVSLSYENPRMIQTVHEQEKRSSFLSRSRPPPVQEKVPLLGHEEDEEIEVSNVVSPSHEQASSSIIIPACVQIPVE